MKRTRIMFWVRDLNDLETIRNLGCNVIHHSTFDGLTLSQQEKWIAECKRLGLQIMWSALGGSDFARQNREATIKHWKDDPVVFCVITVGDAQTVPAQNQINKYNLFKSWAPNLPLGIDREFWFARNRNWSEAAFDILFPYSYPYQTKYSVDSCYDHLMLSMNYLVKGKYPIIPLLQCFRDSRHTDPTGTIIEQFNRLKSLFTPKGWWYDAVGFYPWSAGYYDDVKRNKALQNEIALLNTGTTPPPPPPPVYTCPYCGLTFTTQEELDTHISEEHPSGPSTEKVFYPEIDRSGTIKGDGTITLGALAIEPQTRTEWTRKSFLSFDTSTIPDNAVIDSAYLRIYPTDYTYGGHYIQVDYCLYGDLDFSDFNRAAEKENIAVIDAKNKKGVWINSPTFVQVNKGGFSQYRLVGTVYTKGTTWISGANTTRRPELHVSYHLPSSPETISTKTILHTCGANIEYKISSVTEKNVALICPYCSKSLGVAGIAGSARIKDVSTIIEQVKKEIAQLDKQIATLESQIAELRTQLENIKKLLGM